MQKQLLYLTIFLVTMCGISSCSNMHGENNGTTITSAIPELLKQPRTTGNDTEWEQLAEAYGNAILSLEKDPDDMGQYLTLAQVFITEARLTADADYYHDAALKMTDVVLAKGKTNKDWMFQAYTLRSGVLLSLHRFPEALDAAEKAYAISEYNAQLLGALVDAHVELGNYEKAVAFCDKMIQLRPDIRSYSRVSYLRQIHGDNQGAIDAMKMAVESGVPGAESTEWARVILGDLLLMTGDLTNAEICFTTADGLRTNYAYAKAGLGRLEAAKGNYANAIRYTEDAIRIITDVSFIEQLAELHALNGNVPKAKELKKEILSGLMDAQKKAETKQGNTMHNASRELAMAYLMNGKFDKAQEYALKDLSTRPDNIDANALCAWIAYLKQDEQKALQYTQKALATNIKHPETLYKAGLIFTSTGNTEKGEMLIGEATAMRSDVAAHIEAIMHQ